MIPQRIQRTRKKGFNLQKYSRELNGLDCIYVGRPGKYGNKFTVTKSRSREDCYILHRIQMIKLKDSGIEKIRKDLAGKNLSCWCPLNVNCHADTLLEIANT